MKKLAIKLSIFSLLLLLVTACASNTPTGTAEKYIKAMQSNDWESVTELIAFEGSPEKVAKQKAQFQAMAVEKGEKMNEETGGIESYSVSDEVISEDGQSAEVTTSVTYGNGKTDSSKMKFKNIDGKWLLSMEK